MHPHREAAHKDRSRRVARHADPADEVQDKRMLAKAFAEHDKQLHPGRHTKLKLATGGAAVEGREAGGRMDRARGKKGKGSKVNVNIISAGGAGPRPVPVPVPVRAPAAGAPVPPAAAMPPGAAVQPRPMPVPPPAGVPGMGAGPMAPGMRKRGGRTTEHKRKRA